MAIPHSESAEVLDVLPLGPHLSDAQTATLSKTDRLEVIRLVLPSGKEIKDHQVPGEITIHCLEGNVVLSTKHADRTLIGGKLLYLQGGESHSLRAVEDSSLLLTILLHHKVDAT